MEKVKTVVDREPISSDYIESKQEFGHVLSQVKHLKPAVWKTAWFYGPVGLAVIAVIVSAVTINPISDQKNETATATTQQNEIHQVIEQMNPVPAMNIAAPSDEVKKSDPLPESTELIPIEKEVVSNDVPEIPEKSNYVPPKKEEPAKNMGNLPHIGKVYTGEIPLSELYENGVIECNDNIKVVAFNIHYNTASGTDTEMVVGNTIPKEVREQIKKYNLGHMIFITDIKGVDSDGHVIRLTSLNYIAMN